jgi:predicted nucleotidyltransferase
MKAYGFIAEFNPFHNGHKLFIDKIKQKYHPDVLIAVMSGNFVQRGDFAVLDKWSRAKVAIENGVDLVIELPFAYAVQPAQYFAEGGVSLLNALSVDKIVFGSEHELDFQSLAKKTLQLDERFQQDYSQSSAANLTDFYRYNGIDVTHDPNQLLGLNYARAIVGNNYDIGIETVVRQRDGYSATLIRHLFSENKDFSKLVPLETLSDFQKGTSVSWDDFFNYLKFQILSHSETELRQDYQMVEGLEYKLKKELDSSQNFTEFIERVKSKRYTMARLRRLMVYTLLNVKESEIKNVYQNPYLRVLGFDQMGQKYLNFLKRNDQKFITRVGKREKTALELELRADSIRQLVDFSEQNFGRIPYMKGVH